MESEEEQHMTTLLCMGFSEPAAIRTALRLANNDINEAVALLTNERPGLEYGGGRSYEPPPAYHEVVEPEVRGGVQGLWVGRVGVT